MRRSTLNLFAASLAATSLALAVPAEAETSSGAKGSATLTIPSPVADTDYGDDSGDWSNDGECDDPRFYGPGMAQDLGTMDVGRDATDCRNLVASGDVFERNPLVEMSSTSCATINFGDNTSDYADDGVCDDPRFAGYGVASMLLRDDEARDSDDCQRLCSFGWVWLRAE